MNCSIAQCLEVVGEWWSMLIIRDVFLGFTRFEDMCERLGISRSVLNQRLNRLVDEGVLARVAYSDHPPRYDYRLTDKGRDLWPVITTMRQWGDKWAAPDGPPIQIVHKACDHVAEAHMVCSECGEPVSARDFRAVAGAGATEETRLSLGRR